MRVKSLFLVFMALMFTAGTMVFADALKGRDLVAKGEIKSLEGKIKIESDEWYILSGDKKYQIHKGPDFYLTEIGLKMQENASVKVSGYLYENGITPVKITMGDKVYSFRDNEGRPLWSGRGQGRNRDK